MNLESEAQLPTNSSSVLKTHKATALLQTALGMQFQDALLPPPLER
jgi:hypothetical protein